MIEDGAKRNGSWNPFFSHTISKATAKGAVASIFTIVNDFQHG